MRQRTEDNALCPWDPRLSRWFLPARPCSCDAHMMMARCDVCNVGNECHTEPPTFRRPVFIFKIIRPSGLCIFHRPFCSILLPNGFGDPPLRCLFNLPFQASSGIREEGPSEQTSDLCCRPEGFRICFPHLRMTTVVPMMAKMTIRTIRR